MERRQLAPGEAQTYFNADMLEPETLSLAGGAAAVLSARSPGKASPNEDAAAVICAGEGQGVLVVADGCGGMSAGDQAARIVVETLVAEIAAAVRDEILLRAAILDAVEKANRQILDLRNGAAATLALVEIENGSARPYHAGDSQIMLVGGRGKLKLLTTSHSPVGYAVESGLLDQHEAMTHEDRHLVSNVVGVEEMHVEVGSRRKMAQRDGVLVASDGVIDNLLPDEIINLLKSGASEHSAGRIAGLASQRMRQPTDGKPSKPDDQTLIVFSRRGC